MTKALASFVAASFFVSGTAYAGQTTPLEVPKGHFLGISKPCGSVVEARESARRDAIVQILRAIGAQYSVEFSSLATGTPDRLQTIVSERFSELTSGFLQGIESRIVRESVERTPEGLVCTTLIRFPPGEIERARRLSLGVKVSAQWVGDGVVELEEMNGVSVMLTDYRIEIKDRHRHASTISLFFMKVSEESSRIIEGALQEPVRLRGGLRQKLASICPAKPEGSAGSSSEPAGRSELPFSATTRSAGGSKSRCQPLELAPHRARMKQGHETLANGSASLGLNR